MGCVDGLFECVRILWMELNEKVQPILEFPIFKLPKKKKFRKREKKLKKMYALSQPDVLEISSIMCFHF